MASWSEEQLLDLATSMPAMRTTRRLPRAPRLRTSAILQHHSHCPTRWVKQRDPESLQAVFAVARWAWLGPALLVRAHGGSEHGEAERLSPGMRRKLSLELVGQARVRMYVRDLLSHVVDAPLDSLFEVGRSHNASQHDLCPVTVESSPVQPDSEAGRRSRGGSYSRGQDHRRFR